MKPGQGDADLAVGMEEAADRANAAEKQPDWDGLGLVMDELEAAKTAGTLDKAAREELVRKAKRLIPASRSDLRERYEARIAEA